MFCSRDINNFIFIFKCNYIAVIRSLFVSLFYY
nr:MAG TPA: hypothetical protein [Caudoviricetes sp.]